MAQDIGDTVETGTGGAADAPGDAAARADLVAIAVPAKTTFAGLLAGIAAGLLLAEGPAIGPILAIARPIGVLWLNALQMTIVPLVAALLVTGITRMVATARAGPMAARTLGAFVAVLAAGTVLAAFAMPALLAAFPVPITAADLGSGGNAATGEVPGIGAFIETVIAPNIIAAAAETAMLPVIVFFTALAFAVTRLPAPQRALLTGLFAALANAMLVVIGWVLWVAPLGVFALAIGVAANSGQAVLAGIAHYILTVSMMGLFVLLGGYAIAAFGARLPVGRFARTMLPAQTVAFSTQSSLATLPAMLGACRTLGVRPDSADFVLPLAVALFRATGPVMNLAVAIYVAALAGITLTPAMLAIGVLVALCTTIGSVSLPGTISFIAAIGPVAIAMGVPIGPLGVLVAVEVLPDLMRTVGNVTMDVAVAAAVDRSAGKAASQVQR